MRTMLLRLDNKIGVMALFSYGVVGGLSAAISFASFAILWDVLHVYYKIAVTISYFLAILFNFLCNRRFTFQSSGSNVIDHMYRYITMVLLNYAITMVIVHMSVKWFDLSPYVGLIAAAVVTAITGFTLSKFWVFSKN